MSRMRSTTTEVSNGKPVRSNYNPLNFKESNSSKTSIKSIVNSNNSSSASLNNNRNSHSNQIAKERWKLLKKAILNPESAFYNSKHSIRRFNSFGFIKCVKLAYNNPNNSKSKYKNQNLSDDDDIVVKGSNARSSSSLGAHKAKSALVKKDKKINSDWYNVSFPMFDPDLNVSIRFYHSPVDIKDLAGFNNTGNVCLWPSEEIMTYFCLKNNVIFDDKSVCELGGGMTCLAGLMIAKSSQPKEVFLTDGNESSFENLEVICSENEFECSVECCLLQWNKEINYGDLEERFDFILCADCLFFDEFREDLCVTIYKLLKHDGTCLIFAPNRSNTFHKFVDMAKVKFECMIVNDYDLEVWEKHLYEKENNPDYDEDIHYPLLLKLKKRTRATNDFCKMVF